MLINTFYKAFGGVNLILNIHFPFGNQITSFLLWIDSMLLKVFSIFYKTFLKLAQQEIFKDNAFDFLYKNIYLLVGIVALFLMSYMLLKMMVNPTEEKSGKQIKDMVVRFVVAMGLTILLPTIFGFLKDFQNALLEYSVVPKILLDSRIEAQHVDENGNAVGQSELVDLTDVNMTTVVMEAKANELVAALIQGLMYPLNEEGEMADKVLGDDNAYHFYLLETDASGNPKEWTTNVSDWWDGKGKAIASGVGCAAGAIGGGLLLLIPGIGALVGGYTLGGALAACIVGGVVSYGGTAVVAAIDADEYTWTNALQAITIRNNYSEISLFSQAIVDGDFHYTPILSTIVIGIIVYMMIGFCIDVVVRQAKLIFYQLLAPICFLMSVNPKSKDLLGKWFKLVLTCWLEVFVRIALVCGIVLLVGQLDLDRLTSIAHPIISTFVILGIVIFAKQIPKILKDLTGIDSGNMKLNLREKLAEGGAFAAGAVIGAGAKTFARGAVSAGKNSVNKFKKIKGTTGTDKAKAIGAAVGSIFGGIGTTALGTMRSQITGGINAKGAKSIKDMNAALDKTVKGTENAQAKTHKYIASHGGTVKGVGKGLLLDAGQGIKDYVGAKDEILAKVKAEDTYISTFDDYEALYGDSAYKTLDNYKDQLEAAAASGQSYNGMNPAQVQAALNQVKDQLTMKRLEAIATNKSGAGYVAYNLARQVAEDPEMAEKIGASKDLIRLAKDQDFVLKKDKTTGETMLYHKDGKTQWSTNELTELFENQVANYKIDPRNGKATIVAGTVGSGTGTIITAKDQELYQSKKDVKQKRNNDKNSVSYKEAIKAEQAKEKKS